MRHALPALGRACSSGAVLLSRVEFTVAEQRPLRPEQSWSLFALEGWGDLAAAPGTLSIAMSAQEVLDGAAARELLLPPGISREATQAARCLCSVLLFHKSEWGILWGQHSAVMCRLWGHLPRTIQEPHSFYYRPPLPVVVGLRVMKSILSPVAPASDAGGPANPC